MQKRLIVLMALLSIIFFSFGITNLLFYRDNFLCLSNNILSSNWIFGTGISYSLIGALFVISLFIELMLDFIIPRVLIFLIGGSFTIGWTIYGTVLWTSNIYICYPLYQMILATLITSYITITFTSATLFFVTF
jgi:hypothetical protein